MKRFLTAVSLMSLAACNADRETTSSLNDAPSLTAAEFKLYDQPHVTPNPSCDVYASISLRNGPQGPEAFLVNRVGGFCEIAVFPNERLYSLAVTQDSCGAKTYKGTRITETGGDKIEIVDHRTNVCEIPIPALLVVTETTAQGAWTTYSHGQGSVAQEDDSLSLACAMNDTSATPYLTFLVRKAAGEENASISYVRSAFFGSEEVQFERPVPGCEVEFVNATEISANEVYVECDADGDAGYLSVKRQSSSGSWKGFMTFPNGGVEGYDDMAIAVSCHEQ